MVHRHLNHEQYTLAAIDDAIAGTLADWNSAWNRYCIAAVPIIDLLQRQISIDRSPYRKDNYTRWRSYGWTA